MVHKMELRVARRSTVIAQHLLHNTAFHHILRIRASCTAHKTCTTTFLSFCGFNKGADKRQQSAEGFIQEASYPPAVTMLRRKGACTPRRLYNLAEGHTPLKEQKKNAAGKGWRTCWRAR